MSDAPPCPPVSMIPAPAGYAEWLAGLRDHIYAARQRAAPAVNRELVLLYWQIGAEYMRAFAQAWPDDEFAQAALAQLPWYHQLALLDKLLRDSQKPIGDALPGPLKTSLPSIETIERELAELPEAEPTARSAEDAPPPPPGSRARQGWRRG